MKISIIDIGANTIKLVIYDVKKENSFMGIHQESTKVRVGESLAYSDSLNEQSILKSIDVLLLYRDVAKLESVNKFICVGTSAVREAKNNKYFIDQVLRKTGLKVRVLSGEEEAYYSYLGASMSTCIPNGLFFDLGGGTLEVVYTEDFKVKKVQALPLGALRLTRTFANQNIDWTIVFFHKPFYSAGGSGITNMRRTHHPFFENLGVDLVIQGHSHNYQRTYPLLYNDAGDSEPLISDKEQFEYRDPLGIIFVIVGTGGESVQPLNKKSFLASTYEGYGCINVEIEGKAMNVEYYSDTNNTIDKFLITKNQHSSKSVDAQTEMQRIEYHKSEK